jgi:hypothetical protein
VKNSALFLPPVVVFALSASAVPRRPNPIPRRPLLSGTDASASGKSCCPKPLPEIEADRKSSKRLRIELGPQVRGGSP